MNSIDSDSALLDILAALSDTHTEQIDDMDAELASLRTRIGAEIEVQISRVETQRSRVESRLDEIYREARRLGIPPGWLR